METGVPLPRNVVCIVATAVTRIVTETWRAVLTSDREAKFAAANVGAVTLMMLVERVAIW